MGLDKTYDVSVRVSGGGLKGQSEAILSLVIKYNFSLNLLTNIDIKSNFFSSCKNFYFYLIKLAISRCLYSLTTTNDKLFLKSRGFLTRNSLCKERRSLDQLKHIYIYNSFILCHN